MAIERDTLRSALESSISQADDKMVKNYILHVRCRPVITMLRVVVYAVATLCLMPALAYSFNTMLFVDLNSSLLNPTLLPASDSTIADLDYRVFTG